MSGVTKCAKCGRESSTAIIIGHDCLCDGCRVEGVTKIEKPDWMQYFGIHDGGNNMVAGVMLLIDTVNALAERVERLEVHTHGIYDAEEFHGLSGPMPYRGMGDLPISPPADKPAQPEGHWECEKSCGEIPADQVIPCVPPSLMHYHHAISWQKDRESHFVKFIPAQPETPEDIKDPGDRARAWSRSELIGNYVVQSEKVIRLDKQIRDVAEMVDLQIVDDEWRKNTPDGLMNIRDALRPYSTPQG
jgi:hypothetical protein